ncbi:MAG: hypothetical protein JWR00_2417 [Rubritepida sp.]|nr:hypothetical protein [Rubritepida sp.]
MRSTPLAMLLAVLLATPAMHAETLAATPPFASTIQLTESQARSRIEETGYTQVSDLRIDERGLWRGRASRNGDPREVSLDDQGNLEDPWELAALTMFDRESGELATAGNPAPTAGATTLMRQVSH